MRNQKIRNVLFAVVFSIVGVSILNEANVKPQWSGNLCKTAAECR